MKPLISKEMCQKVTDCKGRIDAATRRSNHATLTPRIIAASKTQTAEIVRMTQQCGIDVFGENYVQELQQKSAKFDQNQPAWHFIGHLQSNKVRQIAGFISMIQSVDSVSLAEIVSKEALRVGRVIPVLLQVNTSGEDSKDGVEPAELRTLVGSCLECKGIELQGLMTIPEPAAMQSVPGAEFRLLRDLRDDLAMSFGLQNFLHLSMGMSDDFELAVEEGATLVRLGTILFGQREVR